MLVLTDMTATSHKYLQDVSLAAAANLKKPQILAYIGKPPVPIGVRYGGYILGAHVCSETYKRSRYKVGPSSSGC